jgi:hypothetical protein
MDAAQPSKLPAIWRVCADASGAVLGTSLVFLAVLTLLGIASIITTMTDTRIGGNYKTSVQALYASEAGIEEARARLRANAGGIWINDASPNPQWKAYIASGAKSQAEALQQAQDLGYDPHDHDIYASLQSSLDYTVVIQRATGGFGDMVLTSHGSTSSAHKAVEVVVAKPPPFTVPAALYVEEQTSIQGATTDITGLDQCGNDNKPGILTTLPPDQQGETTVWPLGSPPPTIIGTPDDVVYNGTNLNIQAMVDSFQEYANFTYAVSSATHTGNTTPGPGDGWGQPTLGATPQAPSSCDDYHIVHYDTGGTFIKLDNGVSGCGMLLVEGDLEIHRGFSWYGVILVTGTIAFVTPEVQENQITGAVLAGGSMSANDIGLKSHIVYCSTAVNTQNLSLRVLSWNEL